MTRHILAAGAVAAGLAAVGLPARAKQAPVALRDFAMAGGNYYLRAPEFVDGAKVAFLADDDRVIGVTGDGVTKAYPAGAVTWHHGVEDRIGKLPVFVTW